MNIDHLSFKTTKMISTRKLFVVTMDGEDEGSYNHTKLAYYQDDMQLNVGWLGPSSSAFSSLSLHVAPPPGFSLSCLLVLPFLLPAPSA